MTAGNQKLILRSINFVSRQEKSFKINMLRVASQNFLRMDVQPYQPMYIKALGATAFQLGIANGIGGLAGMAVALPAGWLADRYGIKTPFSVATLLMIFGGLLFALSPNWMMTIPAMFIATFGLRMAMTVCPVVCGSCFEDKERATGMQLCDTVAAVPRAISPIIYTIIVTELGGMNENGIRPLYYLQVVGFCLILVLILRKFTEPIKGEPRKNPQVLWMVHRKFLQREQWQKDGSFLSVYLRSHFIWERRYTCNCLLLR